ncbi:MAG: helix-turn-helix domain-containing protein [Desulfobacterales bacterium]|nr:helix-turn-helix domain-containing protein [Desulfobacterales bacterium]
MANKRSLSFGRYLKNVRLDRGINLQQVSMETRIGIDNLLAIEREDHDRLPAEVFVKGFIRGYAKSVGADADDAVRLYLSGRRTFQETARVDADLIKSGINFWPRLLLSLGVLFCIMTLSVFITSFPRKSDVKKEKLRPKAITKNELAVSTPLPQQTASPLMPLPTVVPEKLLLKILTVEKTWLKVIIDDQKSREYSLNPGDRLELEALSEFNLLIGNAAGVHLNINDKDLPVPGNKGQVVALKIP